MARKVVVVDDEKPIADILEFNLKMMVLMQLSSYFTTIQTKVMKLTIKRRLLLKE